MEPRPALPVASHTARPVLGIVAACALLASLPQVAVADIVTGTVTPAGAKVTVVDASGATVAELKPGAYQIQLPVGKYKAQCQAPKQKSQVVLVLSEPVTVNIDCG